MKKELLIQLITTLSGYSNEHNWKIKDGEYVWVGESPPFMIAKNVLDLVASTSDKMENKEPENRQYELFN